MNSSVILSGNMDAQLRQTVEKACANEGLRFVTWNSSQILSPNEQHAVLLVGELQGGSRNVPESLSALATRQFPQALMMLFCNEPLARKSKTIHHGRLTLVGPPPDLETVSSSLRTAFGLRSLSLTKNGNGSNIRQLRGRRWWAGSVSHVGANAGAQRLSVPFMEGQPDKGVGFWLPDGNTTVDTAQIETGLDLLGSKVSDSRLGKSGNVPLAALTLNLAENSWRIFHAHPHVSCWLISQKRFPNAWHLSALDAINSVQRFAASAGDIIALWHDPARSVKEGCNESKHLDPEMLLAAECGGHALLDLLNTQCSKNQSAFNAIVAEVR